MAINPEDHDTLIDRLVELFQSNEAAIDYGQDPGHWVEENLPEGTEPADVAGCMPEVGDRLGGPYQQNLGHYNAGGHPVTTTVVNEISYTYNTVYQQNAFIYAEEGAQVVNIQGDGNTVTQVDIDQDFGVEPTEDHPEDTPEETPVDEPVEGDEPTEDPVEAPEDTDEDPTEDPGYEDPTEDPGWEDPTDTPEEPMEPPVEEPADAPEDTPEDIPEM